MRKKFSDQNKRFRASEGWLDRWKIFYSICQLNVNSEKLSADEVDGMLYCDELADTIFDHYYCMDQIFNADETSQNHKTLPSKTLAAKVDRGAFEQRKTKNV